MKTLVTGTSGFVGSQLIPQLIETYGANAISAFVLPEQPLPDSWKHQKINLYRGDILDSDSVLNTCRNHTQSIRRIKTIFLETKDYEVT